MDDCQLCCFLGFFFFFFTRVNDIKVQINELIQRFSTPTANVKESYLEKIGLSFLRKMNLEDNCFYSMCVYTIILFELSNVLYFI